MPSDFVVKLEGVDELKRALANVTKSIRTKAVRSALRAAGKVIQQAARANAPILSQPKPGRSAGTIKKAITVRTSKYAKLNGDEGVYIGVKPLSEAKKRSFKQGASRLGVAGSGKDNPNDPYYWRWVEFGHKIVPRGGSTGVGVTAYQTRLRNGEIRMRKRKYSLSSITGRRRHATGFVQPIPFMRTAANSKANEAISVFMKTVIPQIEKLNNRVS